MKRILLIIIFLFSLATIAQEANPRLTVVEQLQYQLLVKEQENIRLLFDNLNLRIKEFKAEVEKAHPESNFDVNTGVLYKKPLVDKK